MAAKAMKLKANAMVKHMMIIAMKTFVFIGCTKPPKYSTFMIITI